jgi:VanZ family protein
VIQVDSRTDGGGAPTDLRGRTSARRSSGSVWRWLANAAYAAILVVLALLPSIPPVAGRVIEIPDWAAHGTAYGVQAALLIWAWLPSIGTLRSAVAGIVGASSFGAVTETLQLLQPARSVEARDLAANAIGALVFGGLVVIVRTAMSGRRT